MYEQKLGEIIGLFIAPKDHSGYPRPSQEELILVANEGIEGDKFKGRNADKAVLIVGLNSYELAKENGIELEFGSLGENILFDFDPHILPTGTKIKIDEVELEVVKRCKICSHLSYFDQKLPKVVKEVRGIYCKINKGGKIDKNSRVVRLIPQEEFFIQNSESKKLYACISKYPNHFLRIKTQLLVKDFFNNKDVETEIKRLEAINNPLEGLDEYADYPDFAICGFIRTKDGKIDKMGGVMAEIEITFPSSNPSYLQILSEKIRKIVQTQFLICAAIDIVEIVDFNQIKKDGIGEILFEEYTNIMMSEDEQTIYKESLNYEFITEAWNVGLFMVQKDKPLANILGFFP